MEIGAVRLKTTISAVVEKINLRMARFWLLIQYRSDERTVSIDKRANRNSGASRQLHRMRSINSAASCDGDCSITQPQHFAGCIRRTRSRLARNDLERL